MAKIRSSGLQPMPHTLAFSNGGCTQRTCRFNLCTMTSPNSKPNNYYYYIDDLPNALPLSLLMAIKSIL